MSKMDTDKPKRGPGRPPTRGETMRSMVPVRMTEAEHESALAVAAARGVDLSTLIRNLLAAAAGRPLDAPAAAPAPPVAAPAPAAAPARPVGAPAPSKAPRT